MAQHLTDRLDRAVMAAAQAEPVGYFCQYVAPELIEAAGLAPVRLGGVGTAAGESRGERIVHSDACSFCKESLGLRAAGHPLYASLRALIVPSTCDQMRRHGELHSAQFGTIVHALGVPITAHTGGYFAAELERLSAALGAAKLGGDALASAMEGWAMVRRLLRELRPKLSARAFHLAVHLSFIGRSADIATELRSLETDGDGREAPVRLLLAGGPIAQRDTRVFDIITTLPGAGIVANATCTGERWAELPQPDAPTLAALARSYETRPPCAWRRPNNDLYEYLARLVDERGVTGVIWRTLPFCDVWRCEVEQVRDTLGVPVLHLDQNYAASSEAQTRTRLEAFVESLRRPRPRSAPRRRFRMADRAQVVASRGTRAPAPPVTPEADPQTLGYSDPPPARIDMATWDRLFASVPEGFVTSCRYLRDRPDHSTPYVMPPSVFCEAGDGRLAHLRYDNSLAALRLWAFLETEETRLFDAHAAGKKVFGVMKDLGTVPVMLYASDNAVAFYPEGAWWLPCIKQMSDGLLRRASRMGFGEDLCPARATLGALETGAHWPIPDLFIGAVGACCDDMSAIMQRMEAMGAPVLWWELPLRHAHEDGPKITLSNGETCSARLAQLVVGQLRRLRTGVEAVLGEELTDDCIAHGILEANRVRRALAELRDLAYGTTPAPIAGLEMLICEMLAIHFCSDRDECLRVLQHVLDSVRSRATQGQGVLPRDACRITWVNPVADLRMVNLFEDLGGRVAGTELLFTHALTPLCEDVDPLTSLAYGILQDPMIGTAAYRAARVLEQVRRYGAEGVLITRIPGASHCASEGRVIADQVRKQAGVPVLEVEVPPLIDAHEAQLRTRLEAFFESIRARRVSC